MPDTAAFSVSLPLRRRRRSDALAVVIQMLLQQIAKLGTA